MHSNIVINAFPINSYFFSYIQLTSQGVRTDSKQHMTSHTIEANTRLYLLLIVYTQQILCWSVLLLVLL